MNRIAILLSLLAAFLGCGAAFPVSLENADPVILIPILYTEPAGLKNDGLQDDSSRFLASKLQATEDEPREGRILEKRDAKGNESEDLETAAGTYALRPLFVYRQQLAYRQRARDVYRRNRFL